MFFLPLFINLMIESFGDLVIHGFTNSPALPFSLRPFALNHSYCSASIFFCASFFSSHKIPGLLTISRYIWIASFFLFNLS